MPENSVGVYTLPPSYKVANGDPTDETQHNPPFEDVAQAISNRLHRDGRTSWTGDQKANGNKLTGLANGVASSDAAAVGQVSTLANTGISGATTKTTPVDADGVVVTDSAASDAVKRVTWANIKATLKAYFDTLYQATGVALLKSGGTMTGKITLDGDPSSALHAATKQYVDGHAAALSFGAVGTFVFGVRSVAEGIIEGSIYAGSSIYPGGISSDGPPIGPDGQQGTGYTRGASALAGSWRALGRVNFNPSGAYGRGTLFVRIL